MKSEEQIRLTCDGNNTEHNNHVDVNRGVTINRSHVCVLIVALVNISAGCVYAYTSPALPDIIRHSFQLSSDQQAWACSIVNVGAFVASVIGGWSVQLLGRKLCLLLMMMLFSVGWLITLAADSLPMLLAGRFVSGMCLGLSYILVPGYLAEITTATARNSAGAYPAFCVEFGMLLVHFFGMFMSWRYLALLCMAIAAVTMLLLLYVKESPRWLMSKGRKEEAYQNLLWLHGEVDDVKQEYLSLERHHDLNATNYFPVCHLFSKDVYKPLLLSAVLVSLMLLPGINYLWCFALSIFESAKVSLSPHLQTNLFALAGIFGCLTSIPVLHRYGRKQLLVVTAVLMMTSLIALGSFFYMTHDPSSATLAREYLYWLPLTSLVIYQFSFALAWNPLPFIIMNELLPTRARAIASGLVSAYMCLLVITTTVLSVKARDAASVGPHGLFFICAAFSACAVVFVVLCIPETKGKTLEEINDFSVD